jgi:hypothetical protein
MNYNFLQYKTDFHSKNFFILQLKIIPEILYYRNFTEFQKFRMRYLKGVCSKI